MTDDGAEELEQYLTPGESVGDLSFFFGMRHLNTVRVSASNSCTVFTLKKNSFTQVRQRRGHQGRADAAAGDANFELARYHSVYKGSLKRCSLATRS